MKSSVKRFGMGVLAGVLGAAAILAGCSSSGPVGGTLINSVIGDAAILLPTLTQDAASSYITQFIYDGLATYDDKLNPHPAIAESWEVKDDKIYTFKIRKGVKFHDGKELTAHDVVFTYLTIAHPKYQGVRFGDFTSVLGWKELADAYQRANDDLKARRIDDQKADALKLDAYAKFVREGGIQAPDDYTFRVEAAEPFAPLFLRLTSYGIMPKHLLEKDIANLKSSAYAMKPVGTGAMKFVEWIKDDHITLERNPDWKYSITGRSANIARMIVKVLPDQQANMIALEAGETDLADITPEQYDHFKNHVKHVAMFEYMTYQYTFLGYNHLNPKFADKRVRQAITHAIDRQEIVDQILLGHGTLANSHASPARWDYNPDVPVFAYDVAKAERLLDEAGWVKGADGIRRKDGQRFTMEIATNSGNKLREQSAVIIQQALLKVGIAVTINLMEWNAFLEYIDSDKKEGYILAWGLGFDPDAHGIFHSEGGFQPMTGYKSARVDELIMRGRVTTDRAERKQIYGEMQQVLAEEQVYTFLYFSNTIAGLNTRVKGARNGSPNGLMWNFEEWYLADTRAQ